MNQLAVHGRCIMNVLVALSLPVIIIQSQFTKDKKVYKWMQLG